MVTKSAISQDNVAYKIYKVIMSAVLTLVGLSILAFGIINNISKISFVGGIIGGVILIAMGWVIIYPWRKGD